MGGGIRAPFRESGQDREKEKEEEGKRKKQNKNAPRTSRLVAAAVCHVALAPHRPPATTTGIGSRYLLFEIDHEEKRRRRVRKRESETTDEQKRKEKNLSKSSSFSPYIRLEPQHGAQDVGEAADGREHRRVDESLFVERGRERFLFLVWSTEVKEVEVETMRRRIRLI